MTNLSQLLDCLLYNLVFYSEKYTILVNFLISIQQNWACKKEKHKLSWGWLFDDYHFVVKLWTKIWSYLLRMASTASSYFMPNSIRAMATRTGARPSPVTQWTPTQVSGFSVNSFLTTFSHLSTISWLGGEPSVMQKKGKVKIRKTGFLFWKHFLILWVLFHTITSNHICW